MLRVAVVGSGPSGVYTAQSLVEQTAVPGVRVHVLDRLPCPYGLVRYGVAPDHEKIKTLQGSLRAVLEHERVTFVGNVPVGGGALPPHRLLELYHAVVYCVGAARDRRLGIPGEDLAGSGSATDFVSWYSAHPDAPALPFGLDGVRSAVVIGAGNVAVDVTRVLARDAEELRPTDVPAEVLAAFAASRVREVHMVARRGPSQGRFTTKELRELGTLPGARVAVDPADLAPDPAYADPSGLPAVNRRNVEVIRSWAEAGPSGAADRSRTIRLRFHLRPVEVLGRGGRVVGVRFERTVPDGSGGVRGTGVFEDIPADLVLRAVGYRGAAPEGLPFDPVRGTVPHAAGRGTVARGVRRGMDQARAVRGDRHEPAVRQGDRRFRAGGRAPAGAPRGRRRPARRPALVGPRPGRVGGVAVHRAGRGGAGARPGARPGEDPRLARPPGGSARLTRCAGAGAGASPGHSGHRERRGDGGRGPPGATDDGGTRGPGGGDRSGRGPGVRRDRRTGTRGRAAGAPGRGPDRGVSGWSRAAALTAR